MLYMLTEYEWNKQNIAETELLLGLRVGFTGRLSYA